MEFFGKVKGGLVNFWKGRNFSELGSWSHVKVFAGFVTVVALMRFGYVEWLVRTEGVSQDPALPAADAVGAQQDLFPSAFPSAPVPSK